jgi:hypothetical protein
MNPYNVHKEILYTFILCCKRKKQLCKDVIKLICTRYIKVDLRGRFLIEEKHICAANASKHSSIDPKPVQSLYVELVLLTQENNGLSHWMWIEYHHPTYLIRRRYTFTSCQECMGPCASFETYCIWCYRKPIIYEFMTEEIADLKRNHIILPLTTCIY